MTTMGRRVCGLLACLLALATQARAGELLVAAAASLTDALEEVGRIHTARTGVAVAFDFGATSALAKQLAAGAPADVFFAADVEHVRGLEQAGLVKAGTTVELLSNALVVVVPATSDRRIASAADVAAVPRLALADPDGVPAGVYARQWLASRGVWDAARPHVVPALDVRASLAAAETEHADAAIVYRTDAATSSRVKTAFAVPDAEAPRIVYALAPLAAAKPETAELVRTLRSPEARDVYRRRGFLVLDGR